MKMFSASVAKQNKTKPGVPFKKTDPYKVVLAWLSPQTTDSESEKPTSAWQTLGPKFVF